LNNFDNESSLESVIITNESYARFIIDPKDLP